MNPRKPAQPSWIEAATREDCQDLLQAEGPGSGDRRDAFFAAEGHDFPASIRHRLIAGGLSGEEVAAVTRHFVDARLAALGRIRPVLPEQLRARLVFVPEAAATAFAAPWRDAHLLLITAGLFEALRAHAITSVLASRLETVERRAGTQLSFGRRAIDYLNLRSVLFLAGKAPLEPIDRMVPEEVRDGGWRIAEVATLFVILHELGHARYASLDESERAAFSSLVRLRQSELLNPSKIEELYADRFALGCFDSELSGPVIHASLVLFSLLGFLDAGGFLPGRSHPLAINRLGALIDLHDAKTTGFEARDAPARQLEVMEQSREVLADIRGREPAPRLGRLVMVAETIKAHLDLETAIRGVIELERSLKA